MLRTYRCIQIHIMSAQYVYFLSEHKESMFKSTCNSSPCFTERQTCKLLRSMVIPIEKRGPRVIHAGGDVWIANVLLHSI